MKFIDYNIVDWCGFGNDIFIFVQVKAISESEDEFEFTARVNSKLEIHPVKVENSALAKFLETASFKAIDPTITQEELFGLVKTHAEEIIEEEMPDDDMGYAQDARELIAAWERSM